MYHLLLDMLSHREKIRPFLEAGLNVRTRTFFEITQTGTICQIYDGPCFYGENTIDLHPQTSQDRFGVLAGVGVELDVWRITIPVTIRINEGLGTYKMKKMMADSYYYDELKTSNIQITAGITF